MTDLIGRLGDAVREAGRRTVRVLVGIDGADPEAAADIIIDNERPDAPRVRHWRQVAR